MTSSADKFSFKVHNLDENYLKLGLSEKEIAARKQVNLRPITIKQVYNWIDEMGLDPDLTADFKKAASRYPQTALNKFVNNHQGILAVLIKKRRELNSSNSIKEEDHAKTTEKEGFSVKDFPSPDNF